MHEQKIPQIPVSEKTTLGEIPELLAATVRICEERFGGCPPMLIFEPIEQSNIPGYQPTVSQAPEELILITVMPVVRDAAFAALKRVDLREPKRTDGKTPEIPKIKENTPFKSIFVRWRRCLPRSLVSHFHRMMENSERFSS